MKYLRCLVLTGMWGVERPLANTIKARYDAGVTNFKQDGTAIGIPISFANGQIIKEIDTAHCLSALGPSKEGIHTHQEMNRVVMPVITPDRENKRQNGRRFKENGEEAFTLTAQDIHGVAISVDDNIDNSSKCICIQGQRIVENRKFEVDKEGLLKELRLRKKEKGISNQEIADSLGIPLTQVEHYFRQDDYWAVPDPELWDDFKKLLGITTTEFDESIMTFEQSIGKYEKGDRFYDVEGLSPTLNCGADINALMKVEKTKQQPMVTDEVIPSEHDMGHIVEIYPGVFVYAIWYEKYQCYIAIRKLLPVECFKLQGWSKDYFEKAEFVNSDSQLYKQAGNGVTVNVVYEIAKRLS